MSIQEKYALTDEGIRNVKLGAVWTAAENLVIVSNEVFADGDRYDPETLQYMEFLGELNRRLAARADAVVEVVNGLPVFHKGVI